MTERFSDEISAGGCTARSTTDTSEQNSPESLPDRYHHSFISLFSLAVQLKIDFLNVAWQPALQLLGIGGSSRISPSNLITKTLSFAFKRTIPRRGRIDATPIIINKERFRSLICEVLVLSHPAIRKHPNVTSLLGISWEFHEGTVWPVLVFPTASHGCLADFINNGEGKEASLEVVLRICAELALGVDALHGQNIVHGDINPRNVLIFYERESYVAKLTDFESSCICDSEDDLVTLRRTLPWNAPEWHSRWFKLKDAKRQDIYSFGLVCFFTLFQPVIEKSIVEQLLELKSNNDLSRLADLTLHLCFDISPTQRDCISRFFKATACLEPEKRELDIENLIRLLTFDDSFELFAKRERSENGKKHVFPNPHAMASITSEFVYLGECDYRVRQCLQESLEFALKDGTCRDCTAQAAISLAVGYQSAFFIPPDDGQTAQYRLSRSGVPLTDIEMRVEQIRKNVNPLTRVPTAISDFLAVWNHDLAGSYKVDGVLAQAKDWLTQEMQARIRVLGGDHVLTRNAKRQLVSVLNIMYDWDSCTRLLGEILQSCQRLGLQTEAGIVIESLAVILANRGRWKEAEKLLQNEFDRSRKEFGEIFSHLAVLENNNLQLRRKYEGRKNEMEELEKWRAEIEALKQVCRERNTLQLRTMTHMGSIYHGQGKFNLAIDMQRQVVKGLQEQLGPDHLHTLFAMASLTSSLVMGSDLTEALQLTRDTLQRAQRLIGPNDPFTIQSEMLLARINSYLGRPEDSIAELEKIIEKQKDVLGPSHTDTLDSEEALSTCYMEQKQGRLALELQRSVVEKSEKSLGCRHPVNIKARIKLGTLLSKIGEAERGIEVISAALKDTVELLGESHQRTISCKVALSGAFCEKGMLREAEELGQESLKSLQDLYGEGHPLTTVALASLAATYSAQGKPQVALPLLKAAVDISTKDTGPQSHQTLSFQSECAKIAARIEQG